MFLYNGYVHNNNNNNGLTVDIHIVALIVHCIRIELEFGKCWFLRRGENRSTRRKTSRSREENQQQTQPTYDAETGNRTRATLVGGECSHHCATPAPTCSPLLPPAPPAPPFYPNITSCVLNNGFSTGLFKES